MSGAQTSPFLTTNELLAPMAAFDTHQNTLLQQQGEQQKIAAGETEQAARIAGTLSDPSLYPTPEARAAGYPVLLAQSRANGWQLPHAPATYPGDDVMRAMARLGTSSTDLYKLQLGQQAGQAAIAGLSPTGSTAPQPGQPAAPTDFNTSLATAESGGKSNVVNQQGYTGTYQFGKQRLAQLGYYTPAPGEDMSDNRTWAGKVSVPGFNVTDQQSFANNPAAQQVVFNTHLGDIDQAIANTPGADRFDKNGLRAVAHLGGVDGMRRFVASGGTYSPADANGTTLSAYYQRFSGGGAPGTQTTAATPGAPQGGVAGRYPGAVQAAGPAAAPSGTPPVAPVAPAAPVPVGNLGLVRYPDGTIGTPGGGFGGAPTQPPVPTPPPNNMAPGGTNGPPAPAPVAPPASTPAPQATPPAAAPQAVPAPSSAPAAVPHLVTPNGQQVPPPPGGVAVLSNGLTPQQWGLVQSELKAAAPGGPTAIAAVLEKVPQLAVQNQQLNMAAWKAAHPELAGKESADGTILYNPNTGEVAGLIPHAAAPTTPRFGEGGGVYNQASKQWERPTPDNMANAVQGKWGVNNIGQETFYPAATTPAEGGYKNMETAYKRDSENISGISAEGRTLQGDQVRVQEMRNLLNTANTGSGTETQAAIKAFLQRWAPAAFTDWNTNYSNLSGPAAIQMFQKLGFMGATSQEQQTTSRGGYLATKLFQQFNPGAQLLTATNQGLLAQRLISNQAGIDYSQGAQDHFAQQEQNFTSSKPSYSSLLQYDRQWQQQRNPQVYAAAIGALGQQDYSQWSKNLTDAEIQRVLDVVHRADPSAKVNGKNGVLDLSTSGQANASPTAAPAVGTVQGGYRFKGGDASQQSNWEPVQ